MIFRALRVLVTVALLCYLLSVIPLSNVFASMLSAKVSYLVAAVFLVLLMRYISACRLRFLTDRQGMHFSTWHLFEIGLISVFYGFLLPGSLSGGAIRWYKLARPEKKPGEAVISIAFDRMIDTLVLVALGIIFWVSDVTARTYHIVGWSFLGVLTGLLIIYFLVFDSGGFSFARRFANKIKWGRSFPVGRQKISDFFNLADPYRRLSLSTHAAIWGFAILRHALGIWVFFLFTASLDMNLTFQSVGWVRSCTLIAVMLPVSIAGFGVREGLLVILLAPYGISASLAVALSLLFFGRKVVLASIGGLFEAKHQFMR